MRNLAMRRLIAMVYEDCSETFLGSHEAIRWFTRLLLPACIVGEKVSNYRKQSN